MDLTALVLLSVLYKNVYGCFQQIVDFKNEFEGQKNINNDFVTYAKEDRCRVLCISYFGCSGYNTNGFNCELNFGREVNLTKAKGWKYVEKNVNHVSLSFSHFH